MIGSKLGPYELVEEIGRGGMAAVYRAYQPNMDRFVAVKILFRAIAADNTSLERFQREARLVARLEHQNILPVYDYNGANDPPYIVMRYMPTGTLKDLLEREQLPPREVAYLFGQIASALDYAHRQGVIHRDIKPSNIMIDGEGNAFLTDFGIARMAEGADSKTSGGLTGTGIALGTPGYMAPEQGMGTGVDSRADIYSLGVMLYQMLSGQMPYSGDTPMAVILKHINEPVPSLAKAKPSLPPGLDSIIQRAMAKNPADRYATAGEMVRELNNMLGLRGNDTSSTTGILKDAANRTIQQLAVGRSEQKAKTTETGSSLPAQPPRPPTGQTPRTGVVAPRPPTGSQTVVAPAARRAAIGLGVVLFLIALVVIVAFATTAIINGNNYGTATAAQIVFASTSAAQAESQAQTQVAIDNTDTATAQIGQAAQTAETQTAAASQTNQALIILTTSAAETSQASQTEAANGTLTSQAQTAEAPSATSTESASRTAQSNVSNSTVPAATQTGAANATNTQAVVVEQETAAEATNAFVHGAGLTALAQNSTQTARASITPSATSSFTATPISPSPTHTATATNSPLPPTATPTTTSSHTPIPPTDTPTVTASHTPIPPTATYTLSATFTPPPPTATLTTTPSFTVVAPTIAPTVATVVPPTVPPVIVPTVAVPGQMPYVTDFEATDTLKYWDTDATNWKLLSNSGNNSLVGTGNMTAPAVVLGKASPSPEWNDPAVQALLISVSIHLDSQVSGARVIFRASNSGYYVLEVLPGLVRLLRNGSGKVDRSAEQVLPGGLVGGAPVHPGQFYQFMIWSDQTRVFVFLEHKLIIQVKDPGTPLPGGLVMLQSFSVGFGTSVWFDNLKIQRPNAATQHFDLSQWPATWVRSDLNNITLGSDTSGNHYIEQDTGTLSPNTGVLTDFLIVSRLQSIQGGFDMHLRESDAGYYLLHFVGGNMTLSVVDHSGKATAIQTFQNFYGRSGFLDYTFELVGNRFSIYTYRGDSWSQDIPNGPQSGGITFVANKGDSIRIGDTLVAETAKSASEIAQWAFDKIQTIEARPDHELLTEFYDYFVDKFAKRDWWEGGVNAPGEPKADPKSRDHNTYLEMTYSDSAYYRIFRFSPSDFRLLGAGKDKVNFSDSTDVYLRVNLRLQKPGTAWIAVRTTVSLGGSALAGYRLALTKAADGSYTVTASVVTSTGQTQVYYTGPLPTDPTATSTDWIPLLIITTDDKVAFFANGRFLNNQEGVGILGGTVALGVDSNTVADFDHFQLRDASPEKH